MSTSYLALLIGGAVPACLWSVSAVLQKMSAQQGLSPGPFLVAFGAMVVAGGVLFCGLQHEPLGLSARAVGFALGAGLFYALAAGLISLALLRFGAPISKLAPILGCNVLLTTLLGIFVLGEGANLSVPRLLAGTAATFVGIVLVTTA